MKTYYNAVKPPYEHDQLRIDGIREDFVSDPILSKNRERMIVVGGANLVLRGIIEYTPDIDVLAPREFLDELIADESVETEELLAPRHAREAGATNTNVRFKTLWAGNWLCATDALGDGYYPMSYDELDRTEETTEFIEGVRCLKLDIVEASKRALGRTKDLIHLDKIAMFRIKDKWDNS